MTHLQTLIHDPVSLRILLSLIILIIVAGCKRFFSKLVIQSLSKIKIKQIALGMENFNCLRQPINYLLVTLGIYFAVAVSPFVYFKSPSEQVLTIGEFSFTLSFISIQLLNKIFPAILVIFTTWLVYRLEHLYEQFFMELNTKLSLIDNTIFIRYLSKILNFITLAFGTVIALVVLIPDFSSIVTGVGIGGVAVAYVAKDSLASMISGMILLLDKPFIIGDWVTVDTIDGIVEDISFRSTRIRTFTQGLVVVPNSTVGNASITNWSRMQKRRVAFELGVSYDTSEEQMTTLIAALQNFFHTHPAIEQGTSLVHFTGMGDYTLNIEIIYYSLKTDLESYMSVKEAVNLEILRLCNTYDVAIAFPTQTILMPAASSSQ